MKKADSKDLDDKEITTTGTSTDNISDNQEIQEESIEIEQAEKSNNLKEKVEDQDTSKEKIEEQSTQETDQVKEIDDLKNKYLRLYSEFDNYRKRTNKEKLDIIQSANERLILNLLPILDDFERAIKNFDDAKDIQSIQEGVTLIYQKFLNSLEKEGLKPTKNEVGQPFDVDKHEAIAQVPSPEFAGKIMEEIEKGYTLNNKVIRYNKVVIGS